jgi:chromosome partitioning protein
MVDRRLAMTTTILDGLKGLAEGMSIPMLTVIRTDQSVTKAARAGQFLIDYDPKCKVIEEYKKVADELLEMLKG